MSSLRQTWLLPGHACLGDWPVPPLPPVPRSLDHYNCVTVSANRQKLTNSNENGRMTGGRAADTFVPMSVFRLGPREHASCSRGLGFPLLYSDGGQGPCACRRRGRWCLRHMCSRPATLLTPHRLSDPPCWVGTTPGHLQHGLEVFELSQGRAEPVPSPVCSGRSPRLSSGNTGPWAGVRPQNTTT